MLEIRPLGLALEEPVTYGQFLAQARVFRSDESEVIARFIRAARAAVETYTGQVLHRERYYMRGSATDFARFTAYGPSVFSATKDGIAESPLPVLVRKCPYVFGFDLTSADWVMNINSGRTRDQVLAEFPQLAQAILELSTHSYDNRSAGAPSLMSDASFLRVLNSARIPTSGSIS